MEELLAEKNPTGKFCDGDSPTVADICLVTQVTPAQLFNTDVEPFKRVMRIYESCMAIPAFADAHPCKQPDSKGTDSPLPTGLPKRKTPFPEPFTPQTLLLDILKMISSSGAQSASGCCLHRRGKDRGAAPCRPDTRCPADVG